MDWVEGFSFKELGKGMEMVARERKGRGGRAKGWWGGWGRGRKVEEVEDIVDRVEEACWVGLFEHGIIHADPHPGNVFYDPDTGEVNMVDFGMCFDAGEAGEKAGRLERSDSKSRNLDAFSSSPRSLPIF